METKEALAWVAEVFEEPAEGISPETERDEIPTWDSLGVLSLMAALDEKFDIVLTEQDMRGMKKVDDILEILRRNGKLNGSNHEIHTGGPDIGARAGETHSS